MQSSGITVYTETSSSFIPFILHKEIHENSSRSKLPYPEANSTFRRQRALRLILHAEGKEIFYPVYKDLQGIPGIPATRPSKGNPVIHDIPDIPVIHDIQPLQASLHIPVRSSTFQYNPVPSSAIQYLPVYPGIPPVPAFL